MGDSVRYGAQADFPGTNAAYFGLCSGSSGAFSSTWVALVGQDIYDIFQVGLDRCRATGCPYPEDGRVHYFWAWGRTHGSVGCEVVVDQPPIAQDLGVWDGLPHTFKVRKVSSGGVQTYRAYIDGTQVASRPASDLCWAGAHSIPAFYAESGDFGDATGGSDTSRYRIDNAQRQDTLGGAWSNTSFQAPCAASSYNYRCQVIRTITIDLWSVHP